MEQLLGHVNPADIFRDPVVLAHARELERFRLMATASGFNLRPDDGSWDRFVQHSEVARHRIARNFKFYADTCAAVMDRGYTLQEDKQMLWQAMKDLKFRFRDDLFERIHDGDIIEIYDTNLVQIFRNLQFFAVSSYSFSQLLHYEFPELFSRPDGPGTKLVGYFRGLFEQKLRGTIEADVPEHVAQELFSESKYKALYRQKILSPLTNAAGKVEAVIITASIRIIEN